MVEQKDKEEIELSSDLISSTRSILFTWVKKSKPILDETDSEKEYDNNLLIHSYTLDDSSVISNNITAHSHGGSP